MRDNVRCEQALKDRFAADTLTLSDDAILALANAAAGAFPDLPVYVSPVRQGTNPPAWFVRFYEVAYAQTLDNEASYQYGFDLSYFPKNTESDFELNDAMHQMLQNLSTFPGTTGEFQIYRKTGSVTDRVAHITGVFTAGELTTSDDPIIQIAEKEVTI